MAYFGKLGALTRQIVARSLLQKNGAAVAALPAVYLLQRGMASSKLFIGGPCCSYSFPFSILGLISCVTLSAIGTVCRRSPCKKVELESVPKVGHLRSHRFSWLLLVNGFIHFLPSVENLGATFEHFQDSDIFSSLDWILL
jgi:hypothetical protein